MDEVATITSLISLVQSIGVLPSILTILTLSLIITGTQLIVFFIKRKETKDALNKSKEDIRIIIEKLTDKVDIIIEGQSFIMSSIEDIAEAIVIINDKFRNNISKSNIVIILKKFIEGYLFSEVIERVRYYIELCKNKDSYEEEELKKQLHLELTNLFDDFIISLNELNTSIDLVKIISKSHYEEIISDFFSDIIEAGCNKSWTTVFKYDKIKASFQYISTKIINTVSCEYEKKRNGGA
jgi:hypothetical protein